MRILLLREHSIEALKSVPLGITALSAFIKQKRKDYNVKVIDQSGVGGV